MPVSKPTLFETNIYLPLLSNNPMRDMFTEKLLSRFEGRKDLGKEGLYERYFKDEGLDKDLVLECFEDIEFDFCIPVGVLRPEDSMTKLTDRITTNNPFLWFWWLGRNEFSGDNLLDDLNWKLKQYGTSDCWKQINTVNDLVCAWCGKKPEERKG
jgi:hypothetical protein